MKKLAGTIWPETVKDSDRIWMLRQKHHGTWEGWENQLLLRVAKKLKEVEEREAKEKGEEK